MRHPPGKLAELLGVNGNAVCTCGEERFYALCDLKPDGEGTLVVLHCCQCHKETPVPLDPLINKRFIN